MAFTPPTPDEIISGGFTPPSPDDIIPQIAVGDTKPFASINAQLPRMQSMQPAPLSALTEAYLNRPTTIRQQTPWQSFKNRAVELEHTLLPGTAEKGSPAPADVVMGASMVAPIGLPENLGKLVLGYFAAQTVAQQKNVAQQLASEIHTGDYSTAAKTATIDALQAGMMAVGIASLRAHPPAEIQDLIAEKPEIKKELEKEASNASSQRETAGSHGDSGASPGAVVQPEQGTKENVPQTTARLRQDQGAEETQAQLQQRQPGISQPAPSSGATGEVSDAPVIKTGEVASPTKTVEMPNYNWNELKNPHLVGVMDAEQQKLTPEDVPRLQELQKQTNSQNVAAGAANDSQRFQAAMGKSSYIGGLIEGAKKAGPNYERVQKMPEALRQELRQASPQLFGQPAAQTGVGGMRYGEFGETGNPDVMGVRQETREKMAAAGQPMVDQPGVGRSRAETIIEGRQLLTNDPMAADKGRDEFEKTSRFNYPDFAAATAKLYQTLSDGRIIEQRFGTDSPEYKAVRDEVYKWSKLTKDMSTEWHRTGMAQQGEYDIDTGSVLGLEAEHKSNTGKDFTPQQSKTAGKIAKKVTDTTAQTDAAREKFNAEFQKQQRTQQSVTASDAEKKALEAAHKTVRENAVRVADAENKTRVAQTELKQTIAEVQRGAAKKALDAANKVVRNEAIRKAQEENEQRVKTTEGKTAQPQVQVAAAKKALEAANKVVKREAIRKAQQENQQRINAARAKVREAQVQAAAAKKALDAANKVVRDQAVRAAKAEVENRVHPENRVWDAVKNYLDAGETNFDDIRNKVATDLGIPVKEVTRLVLKNRQLKTAADEVWKKQQDLRRFKEDAKSWLKAQNTPGYLRAIQSVPKFLFGAKVGFHGTVALGTHAPAVAFQPKFWATYLRNFGKMYAMVNPVGGKGQAYYEMQVQDLLRDKNYLTARRAGLVNDPYQYEDYNSPEMVKYMKGVTSMGNRGYAVLKMLRQDMFNQYWEALPKTAKTPEVAQAIADGVNHATGVVKVAAPKGAALALFAPRLEMSRAAWLATDPIKAANTFANWKNASLADKTFAVNQVKEKAWVMGTLFSLLALNQGVLMATGSDQKINLTNPMKSDWLKFKVAGMDLAYGNALLTMARLPARLYQIRSSTGGKLKNLIYPDEDTYTALGEYTRSQLSPFASLASTLWLKGDWQNRPLPDSSRPVPKRLRAEGVKPYTWKEFFLEQVAPIPAEEAIREVFHDGFGLDAQHVKEYEKAMATLAVMSATGARLTDDVPTKTNGQGNFPPGWFQPQTNSTNVLSE